MLVSQNESENGYFNHLKESFNEILKNQLMEQEIMRTKLTEYIEH